MLKLADTLRVSRIRQGMSQRQLADVSGLTDITISSIERSKVQPRKETREKIEQVLGPVDWQLTFQEGVVRG